VLAMFAVHQGQRIVPLTGAGSSGDLDVCASVSDDGSVVHVTVVNRNPEEEQDAELVFRGAATPAGAAVPLELLTTPRLTPYATFQRQTEMLPMNQDGHVRLHLPRYAVGRMRIALPVGRHSRADVR
jgi:hypothetical protein